ncbi:MAG: RDD family protein [Candidatus Brocadiia bacterium]
MEEDRGPEPERKLVQCDVTGEWVPEDEIITFRGYRVSAEGKAILLERLKSGERLPGEMERPTFMRRLGCLLLDGLVLGLVSVLVMTLGLVGSPGEVVPGEQARSATAGFNLFFALLTVAYFALLQGATGQSLGKMAGRVRVVLPDGGPIGYGKAFVRSVVKEGPQVVPPAVLLAGGASLAEAFQVAVGLYMLVNLGVMLSDQAQHRALHDRVAGTRAIVVD